MKHRNRKSYSPIGTNIWADLAFYFLTTLQFNPEFNPDSCKHELNFHMGEKEMAKIQKDESGEDIINVDEKVGVNGINSPNDVMVVQGMLKYLTQFTRKWTKVILPEPNGSLDKNTQKAIFDYQEFVRTRPNQHLVFWIAKDGSVSSFRTGLKLLHKQQLTITAMNGDCALLSAALNDGKDHIDAITRRFPFTVGVALGRVNPLFL